MKNVMKKLSVYRKGLSVSLSLLLIVSLTTMALAKVPKWTTVGSVGVADEVNRDLVNYNLGRVGLLSSAPANAHAILRYNVDSLAGGSRSVSYMAVRYTDNGAEAQVTVKLHQYHLNTGADTVLLEFDSNNYASNSSYQTRTVGEMGTEFDRFFFDFSNYAYYVEVTLTKTGAAGNPALGIVQLSSEYSS
ncbi:MAG: hypothetical protein JST84_11225 [Acidobacteria bacterium]|nr:hypothetical protein [Acidobacteriota bacterium]